MELILCANLTAPPCDDIDRLSPAVMQQSSQKVAIPRLQRTSLESSEPRRVVRRRAAKACQPCRSRKAKCDEATPICGHCRDLRLDCRYESGKREKQKRQFEVLCEKVRVYEKLLHDLSLSADYASRLRIETVLAKFCDLETIDSLVEPRPTSTPSDRRGSGMSAASPYMVRSARNDILRSESSISCPMSSISPGQTYEKSKSGGMLAWGNSKQNFGLSGVCGYDAPLSKQWMTGLPITGFPLIDHFTINDGGQQTRHCPAESVLPWLGAIDFPSPLAQRQTG
ncbi:transcriptional regulator family: Fungal Specific TF [Paecilomyces variotii]|nr:transcriptional regulator family: Fungal Specific TF [Paecilomyces variotii]